MDTCDPGLRNRDHCPVRVEHAATSVEYDAAGGHIDNTTVSVNDMECVACWEQCTPAATCANGPCSTVYCASCADLARQRGMFSCPVCRAQEMIANDVANARQQTTDEARTGGTGGTGETGETGGTEPHATQSVETRNTGNRRPPRTRCMWYCRIECWWGQWSTCTWRRSGS